MSGMGNLPGNALQLTINVRKLGAVLWYGHTIPPPPPPEQRWPASSRVWRLLLVTNLGQTHMCTPHKSFYLLNKAHVRNLAFLNQVAFKHLRWDNNRDFWLEASCLFKGGVDLLVYFSSLSSPILILVLRLPFDHAMHGWWPSRVSGT